MHGKRTAAETRVQGQPTGPKAALLSSFKWHPCVQFTPQRAHKKRQHASWLGRDLAAPSRRTRPALRLSSHARPRRNQRERGEVRATSLRRQDRGERRGPRTAGEGLRAPQEGRAVNVRAEERQAAVTSAHSEPREVPKAPSYGVARSTRSTPERPRSCHTPSPSPPLQPPAEAEKVHRSVDQITPAKNPRPFPLTLCCAAQARALARRRGGRARGCTLMRPRARPAGAAGTRAVRSLLSKRNASLLACCQRFCDITHCPHSSPPAAHHAPRLVCSHEACTPSFPATPRPRSR